MQNLRKLSILTITFLCANYFSTMAQDEQKAFKEGDKVISIGISGGGGSSGYSKLTPSISFDYGLKGTRGIVSIGGFLSYSNTNSPFFGGYFGGLNGVGYGGFGGTNPDTSIQGYTRVVGFKQHTITAGLRFGLHYATRKWDLYAGTLIGYQQTFRESANVVTDFYKGSISSTNYQPFKSESSPIPAFNSGQLIFSPYVGARYYVSPKVSLNLEIGQHTGNIGIGFKF
jgi:hypothetical protein